MVEGLVLRRAHRLGDRLIPFLAVGEDRVDVEDHAAKLEQAVADHLADREAGVGNRGRRRQVRGADEAGAFDHVSVQSRALNARHKDLGARARLTGREAVG